MFSRAPSAGSRARHCCARARSRLRSAMQANDARRNSVVRALEESAHTVVCRRDELSGLRILTVDDDSSTREMLQQALESAGAVVQTAASAREALEKIQRFHPH